MPNILSILSLIWTVAKTVLTNETVNKAIDNWVNGTSNSIDDMVWKLLESAAGVPAEEREVVLNTGLQNIEAKYAEAKAAGTLDDLKKVTKSWEPATQEDLRIAMAGEFTGFDNVG